ncbi:hypothetical protein Taro_000192 [Colocasia esculenta]|uniref:Uncharacterized protein n=1 Tax=Colocasia esculenta TaxID=4460 RepID=A0A843TCA1_COLES|nr:hypothetical protein [Colocasia esculenta]
MELKLVRPWFKLQRHLIFIKLKLGDLLDDQKEEFYIRICFYISELFSFNTFHISVCVAVVRAFLVLDPRVDCFSDCVFPSDNVRVWCVDQIKARGSGLHKFVTVVSTQSTCVSTLADCPRSMF